MRSIVLCEKPSQAKSVRAAIGNKYGAVYNAHGHLLTLMEPHEINPEWQKWTSEILLPPGGFYPFKQIKNDDYKTKLFNQIKNALISADRVIIATDPDREGQGIGQALLLHLNFKGKVDRAIYNAVDEKTIQDSFLNLQDNIKFKNLYNSFVARQQVEQLYGFTLTRTTTAHIKPKNWNKPLGVGRVKTATLAILCIRELSIRNFVSKAYYDINLKIQQNQNTVTLDYSPKEEKRIFDIKTAQAISEAAKKFEGPIHVITETKRSSPPLPHSLTTLLKAAGKLGWDPEKTTQIAQSLYEKEIITYPRSEVRHLPENLKPEAAPVLQELKKLDQFKDYPLHSPIFRSDGAYSNKKTEKVPHHGIIPNLNAKNGLSQSYKSLSSDEQKLFNIVASTFLATIGDDYIFEKTTISVDIKHPTIPPNIFTFSTSGSVPKSLGWKSIYENINGSNDDVDENTLPPILNGVIGKAISSEILSKDTKPPPRINKSDLPTEMANAWKYIDNPEEQKRLKELSGIGTTATRMQIIKGLIDQKQAEEKGKFIVPSEYGLQIYKLFRQRAPMLVDPGTTARMEARLDDVLAGTAKPEDVIHETVQQLKSIIPQLTSAGALENITGLKSKPTPKMIDFAKVLAEKNNIKLPRGLLTDSDICKKFIDQHYKQDIEQIKSTADKLAVAANITIDPAIKDDIKALSAFIKETSALLANEPATEKQINYIRSLIDSGKPELPGFPNSTTRKQAGDYIKKHAEKTTASQPVKHENKISAKQIRPRKT